MNKRGWFIPMLIVAINALAILVQWSSLPELLPAHYDLQGNASGTMPRSMLLLYLLIGAAVCLIALFFVGIGENLLWEFVVLLLYCLCVSSFGCFLRALFGSTRILALALPLSALLMIGCCPVFFSLPGAFARVSFLFPPTYYLRALGDEIYLLWMMLYAVLLWGLSRLLSRLRRV